MNCSEYPTIISLQMKPKFETTKDRLVIIDPVGRGRYPVKTGTTVTPESVTADEIPYPIEKAVQITTGDLTLPSNSTVYVRDGTGSLITEIQPNECTDLPESKYILDISSSLKIYVYVESAIRIQITNHKTTVLFDKPNSIIIGARSYHTRPRETIKTTTDPMAVMKSISRFGSTLKTTGAEQSYPTHRAHPPTVSIADHLDIPDELTPPETGVQIEVPPTLRHIFVVAPLAYYLPAEVVPASTPQIVTDTGFSYPLDRKEGFETTVERVLNQTFLLDCIVRTEGTTPLKSYERQEIEPSLDQDINELYDLSNMERLERYLNVSYSTVEPHIPKWQRTTKLRAIPDHIGFLPFAVIDLGTITIEQGNNQSVSSNQSSIPSQLAESPNNAEYTGGIVSEKETVPQTWNQGDGSEITSTALLSAFHQAVDQTPKDGPLEIEIVCNDSTMNEELITVYSIYGDRDDVPFDITIHHDLTTNRLQEVLFRESDFLHYIGHIDSAGFRCSDGVLDAGNIGKIGTKAFLLNGCQSHEQGVRLIKAGSIGGIVTTDEICNSEAVRVGHTISYLLNRGYSLYAALDIARMEPDVANRYHIVGDGRQIIAQSDRGSQNVCSVTRKSSCLEVYITSYAGSKTKKGGLFTPYIDGVEEYYVVPQQIGPFTLTKPEFLRFIDLEQMPVFLDGELRLSAEIKTSEL